MTTRIPLYNQYAVTLTRWQALKALIRGGAFPLSGQQVTPLIRFGISTGTVQVEAFGGGGGGFNVPQGDTGGAS